MRASPVLCNASNQPLMMVSSPSASKRTRAALVAITFCLSMAPPHARCLSCTRLTTAAPHAPRGIPSRPAGCRIAPDPSTDARGKQSVDRLYAAVHDLLGRGALEVIDYRVVTRSVHGASPIAAELGGHNPVPAVKADGYRVSSLCSDEAVLHVRRIFRVPAWLRAASSQNRQ